MNKNARKWLFFFLKLVIVGGLVAWLFLSRSISLETFKNLHWGYFLLAYFQFPVVVGIGVIRWRWLLAAQDIHVSVWAALKLTFIGYFFNLFMPGATGGDVIKAYYIAKLNPDKKAEAATTVFVDRALGMYGLLLVGFVALLIHAKFFFSNKSLIIIATFLLSLILGSVLFAIVFFSKRLRRILRIEAILKKFSATGIIRRIDDAVFLYRYRIKLVFAVILVSVFAHLSTLTATLFWARSAGMSIGGKTTDHITTGRFYVVGSVALFMNAMPLAPGGVGSGEAFYAITFRRYAQGLGFQKKEEDRLAQFATAIAVLMHISSYSVMAWGAIPYFFARKMILEALEKSEEFEMAHVSGDNSGQNVKVKEDTEGSG